MTQSIRQLVTATVNDPNFRYLPPEQVAWEVVKQVNPKDWRNVMAPLVVEAVRGAIHIREAANEKRLDSMPDVEHNPSPPAAKSSARGKATASTTSSAPASSPKRFIHVKNRSLTSWLIEMSDVLETTFTTEDNVKVSWKEATVEQHQRRIDMLSVMKNGLEHTIERHRKARDHCIANGVDRLSDLMDQGKEVAA